MMDLMQEAAAASQRYTAGEVLLFFGAASGVIAGVGAVIVNIIVALRTGTKIDAAAVKTDELVASVARVHDVTNSGLSAVKAELATSNALNTELRAIISDLKGEREKAAVLVALDTPAPTHAHDPADHLAQIQVNTKETADNTQRAATRRDDKKGGAS